MKRTLVCSALLVTIGLGSCTLATEVEVFNNSPTLVRLVVDDEETQIRPGKSAKFYERDFRRAEVEKTGIRWTYEVNSAIPESFIFWRGWGWWQSRRVRMQIESDNRVWLLGVDQSFPVNSFVEQPEGFPLVPHLL